jgi:hypothetical protein
MAMQHSRATLLAWLQTALQIELATIPAYLVALLSLQLPENRAVAERIRSVLIEEMLHLALIGNVLNAVGGEPRLDRRAIPRYPLQLTFKGKAFADRSFPVPLACFSLATLETFLKIEQPQHPIPTEAMFVTNVTVPGLTIGEFYTRIVSLLERLDGEGGLFTGESHKQIGRDFYWSGGGSISPVHDLRSAQEAMRLVISQGEAAWPRASDSAHFGTPLQMGHYYRFNEIKFKRAYQPSDDPAAVPTGAEFDVDYGKVYRFKTNPRKSDYPSRSRLAQLNVEFNHRYTLMLLQLQQAFSGEPKVLYTAIADAMHALSPIAHEMMKLPIGGSRNEETGCPTFDWV